MKHPVLASARLLVLGAVCLCCARLAGAEGASAVLRLSRLQAVEEALAHDPAITAVRERVAQAKAGTSIVTAVPDEFA